MKVLTIVGTRPEIIRLSRTIAALDACFEHLLVHTGQNYDYELNEIFFDELRVRKPDHNLRAASGSACRTIGRILGGVDDLLAEVKPDAVLVLGDTNSCLAVYPAKRRKIPVFHMEAGNRCFDQRVPEEINRRLVDHMSDINLPYSSISRDYLLREGIAPDRIIKTGSPMYEVLNFYREASDASEVLGRMELEPRGYYVVSAHREENVDDPGQFVNLLSVMNGLAEVSGLRVLVSAHPRTRKRIDGSRVELHRNIQLSKPFGFLDYLKLQRNAAVVLSDSGTITEESAILGFPALNLREAHERPEGMEEGAVMMTGMKLDCVLCGLEILKRQAREGVRTVLPVADYMVPNVSEKVARIILSYTPYVNRVVWRK